MKGGIHMPTTTKQHSNDAKTLQAPIPVPGGSLQSTDKMTDYSIMPGSEPAARLTDQLNSLLANEFAVFTKTLNFHWNVTGPRFHSIHKFLDDQYHELLIVIDSVAERIREIDGNPIGTLREMQTSTTIVERPGLQPDTSVMLESLMSDHKAIEEQLKFILSSMESKAPDPGTEDFLTSLLKKHEEMSWMLKSHIGN
jgi:starvation-inducible DNA-binding protein